MIAVSAPIALTLDVNVKRPAVTALKMQVAVERIHVIPKERVAYIRLSTNAYIGVSSSIQFLNRCPTVMTVALLAVNLSAAQPRLVNLS